MALARKAKAKALKHEQLAKNRFDVLINSTPCGMTGTRQALPIKEDELNAGLVFDMVYTPLETPLLKLAASRGLAGDWRPGDVCATGRAAVRNLDGQTGAGGGDAAGGGTGVEEAQLAVEVVV